ncbi:tumor necrosis factor (ligand) superfamily, member 10 like 3 isoform X2 [Osmerus mordax]|uniref:tumor necrosis factor (ligand) superfamily, member 10 like 3 isoform X2 n=1 Tax=Osmerus mordax TaxID=8014 RepID=UPI003510D0B1
MRVALTVSVLLVLQLQCQALEEVECLRLLGALQNQHHAQYQNQHRAHNQNQHRAHNQTVHLHKAKEQPEVLTQQGVSCFSLAQSLRTYISKVTERIVSEHILSESLPARGTTRNLQPSAHLTLRDSGLQGPVSSSPQRDLHQSCRYPVLSWSNHSMVSHLYNMSMSGGRLRVARSGLYHVYAQLTLHYASLGHQGAPEHSHQLVLCISRKTSYAKPILLLKGVATRRWAPDPEPAVHSLHQGALFSLRAGDQLLVSVSSPAVLHHPEDAASYFGASRYDP